MTVGCLTGSARSALSDARTRINFACPLAPQPGSRAVAIGSPHRDGSGPGKSFSLPCETGLGEPPPVLLGNARDITALSPVAGTFSERSSQCSPGQSAGLPGPAPGTAIGRSVLCPGAITPDPALRPSSSRVEGGPLCRAGATSQQTCLAGAGHAIGLCGPPPAPVRQNQGRSSWT